MNEVTKLKEDIQADYKNSFAKEEVKNPKVSVETFLLFGILPIGRKKVEI